MESQGRTTRRMTARVVEALPRRVRGRLTGEPIQAARIRWWKSSVMLIGRARPVKTHARLESELPVHNPVADARQSARWLEAIRGHQTQVAQRQIRLRRRQRRAATERNNQMSSDSQQRGGASLPASDGYACFVDSEIGMTMGDTTVKQLPDGT